MGRGDKKSKKGKEVKGAVGSTPIVLPEIVGRKKKDF